MELENPIHFATASLVFGYIFAIGVLYISSPAWIQRPNSDDQVGINWGLTNLYSLTFALICAAASLLFFSSKRKNKPLDRSFPSPAMARAYTRTAK